MSLRRRFVLYLLALHLFLGGAVLAFAWPALDRLLLVEAGLALSALIGFGLLREMFGTLSVLRSGAEMLKERDFQTRLKETGREDVDVLIRVYNRMADHLRDDRTRLQEQQYLLSALLEASPSGIAMFDFDGRVTFANAGAARLLGHPAEALLGRAWSDINSPLAPLLAEMKPGESRVAALPGGRRIKAHRGQFVDRGFPRAFVLLEELTEELRQHEKAAYEKVIRMLSHEVNNSMGATRSLLQSCLHYAPQLRAEDRADYEAALKVALDRTEHLSVFMRGFAEVVRLPAPRRQPVDLRELMESIAVLMRPASEERRVAWRWEVEETPLVSMDRAQMEQVLVNVCKNALEAVGREGTLTVRIHTRDGAGPALTIEDSGPGIPADVQSHLFTPFFSTKPNGQGLGLTLVQEILAQHRFEYTLAGPPGGPTRFTIAF